MIPFFSNLYKSDPIQFFMIIATIYLLLSKSNVTENLQSNVVDVNAISTANQLYNNINKAVNIDPAGNMKFFRNVTNNGNVITKGDLNAKNIYLNRNIMFKPVNQPHKGYTYALYGWNGGGGDHNLWLEMSQRHNNHDPKSKPNGQELHWKKTVARLHPGGLTVPQGSFSARDGMPLAKKQAGHIEPTTGHWGGWGGMHTCPPSQYVCGGQGRLEGNKGDGDDTAMNGFRLKCCKFN